MSNKLALGLQLYSLRQHIQNEADFAETMKKVADIGYKFVQVSAIGEVSPESPSTSEHTQNSRRNMLC